METVTGRSHIAAPHCRTIAEAKFHLALHIAVQRVAYVINSRKGLRQPPLIRHPLKPESSFSSFVQCLAVLARAMVLMPKLHSSRKHFMFLMSRWCKCWQAVGNSRCEGCFQTDSSSANHHGITSDRKQLCQHYQHHTEGMLSSALTATVERLNLKLAYGFYMFSI